MANLTNALIANTFKDLLQVNAATSNDGLDGVVRTIQDGGGTASPIAMSTAQFNVIGDFAIGGSVLTATVSQINNLVGSSGTVTSIGAATAYGTGLGIATLPAAGIVSVGTIELQANQSFATVSVSTALAGTVGGFSTSLSATNFVAGTGSFTTKVSGVAAEFSGDVSAANLFATTNIFIGGTGIPTASDIAAVSALTSVNKAAVTSINTVVAALSSTLATSIGNTNTALATVSAALATSIGNTNTALAAVSSGLATSIGNTNTVLAATSAALATSIGNTNTALAAVSSGLATSIGNHLPLAGGTLTGVVSGTNFFVSAVAVGTNALLGKDIRIEKAAVADIQQLTDGTNISVDFNAGQNFTVTLGGNRTLDNPTNCVAGQVGSIFVVQDGTGSRTLAYGTSWDFAGGEAPVLTTDADGIDRLDYIVHTSTDVQTILTKAYS